MKETKNITEGAILLGIYVLLLLMTLFVPLLGMVTMFAMVVPFVIYTIRNGWKAGVWFLILANILSVLLGSPVALMLSVPVSSVGLVMGHLFTLKKNRYAILGAATGVYLLNFIIGYIIAIVLFEINFLELLRETTNESLAASEAILSALGQGDTDEIVTQMRETIDYFSYLLPSFLVTASFVFAFISQLIASFILKRLKVEVQTFPPFRELVLPKSLLWYYLIVLVFSMMKMEEGSTGFLAIFNLSYILMLLMAVQGFSFLFFLSYEKNIPKVVPILALIFSFLLPPLLYIIRMVGIVDIGFDLRKRIKNKQ